MSQWAWCVLCPLLLFTSHSDYSVGKVPDGGFQLPFTLLLLLFKSPGRKRPSIFSSNNVSSEFPILGDWVLIIEF